MKSQIRVRVAKKVSANLAMRTILRIIRPLRRNLKEMPLRFDL